MWEVLIASVPILALLLLWPETSGATILHQRAERLRKQSGNELIRTRAEIAHQHKPSAKDVVVEALLMPARITALDPAILFTNVYMMLVYGIYYSFFESFPLVWGPIYGFDLLQSSLAFIPFIVGTSLALSSYTAYLYYYRVSQKFHGSFTFYELTLARPQQLPRTLAGKRTYPEQVLLPAMASCFLPPIGMLIFGWTARPDIHWIVPMIGVTMYPMGVFVIFQGIFLYLPQMYPQYAASLFAAADTTRSVFAVAAIHFARPLFLTLGIGGGCSLLAGLMVLCIFGLYALYHFGPALRARSKFAEAS
jgi:DHA1 family multidrug resistance protein-like MFS transporter